MRPAGILLIIGTTAALAACGSSAATGTSSTPSSAAPSPSATATARSFSPSPVDTATLTCADFDAAAPQLLSALHALAQYINGGGDAGPNLAELATAMGVLDAMAPACAPKAAPALTAMSAAVAKVENVYSTDRSESAITTDKEALDAVKAAGLPAWKAMGLDPAAWDPVLHYYF